MTIALIVVAVVLVGLLWVARSRPNVFEVRRTAAIAAPPEKIYPHLEDFHRWGEWSPWEKLDPALERTFVGESHGRGAVYRWSGNKKAGRGRMEITSAVAPSRLVIDLDFIAPFKAHNVTEITLTPAAGTTTVSWTMTGHNSFVGKMWSLVFNMDKMVGKDFEAALANLKSVAEH